MSDRVMIDKRDPIPKYIQLKEILSARIRKDFKPGDRFFNVRQLMSEYEVALTTVRQAMSELEKEGIVDREQGKGTFVKEPQIVQRKEEMDIHIVCDNSSSSPASNPMYWFVNYYVLQGVVDACKKFNCRPNFVDYRSEKPSINKSKEVIVTGGGLELIEEVKAKAHFMVIPYYPLPEIECNNVIADWEKTAYDAVQHLLKLGHQRIGLLGAEEASGSDTKVGLRKLGYKKALDEMGLYTEEFVRQCGHAEEAVNNAVFSLLDGKDRPTAIFAVNDSRALGAIKAIKQRGLRVPEDVAVVGYDDIPEASLSVPSLTTAYVPRYECGHESVRLLVHLIKGEKKEPQTIVLPGKLVIRESCGSHLR